MALHRFGVSTLAPILTIALSLGCVGVGTGTGTEAREKAQGETRLAARESARTAGAASDPGAAWTAFTDQLEVAGRRILEDDFPGSPQERAEGYRHLARMTALVLQWDLDFDDPEFPRFFRHDDDVTQWGGPNVDNTYLRARIDGSSTYRLWGNISSVREVIVSTAEGDMHEGKFAVGGDLMSDQLEVDEDGNFELILSPDPHPAPWLQIAPGVDFVNIRTYYSDWRSDSPAEFHIRKLGNERAAPARLDPDRVAAGLDRTARWIISSLEYWKEYMARGRASLPPNSVTPPRSVKGGSASITYGSGRFDLEPGQALLIETDVPSQAVYWSWQWYVAPWFEAPDYVNRQTHLTGDMMHVSRDGKVRIVFADRDPGIPNWIDTEGRESGSIAYRYVGASDAPAPGARLIAFDEIAEALPSDTPRVTPAERAQQIEVRRSHIERRFRR